MSCLNGRQRQIKHCRPCFGSDFLLSEQREFLPRGRVTLFPFPLRNLPDGMVELMRLTNHCRVSLSSMSSICALPVGPATTLVRAELCVCCSFALVLTSGGTRIELSRL